MIFLSILSGLIGLVDLAIFIVVLIKLFQKEGTLKGILGLICALYTFIWGWMHSKELNIRNIMLIWSALIVVNLILYFITIAMTAANNNSGVILHLFG
jgi:hypothetical protein